MCIGVDDGAGSPGFSRHCPADPNHRCRGPRVAWTVSRATIPSPSKWITMYARLAIDERVFLYRLAEPLTEVFAGEWCVVVDA